MLIELFLRNKEFQFNKKNFSFVLPRPLTLAHVVIRALFMNFDFFSSRSKTYACRVKPENFTFGMINESLLKKSQIWLVKLNFMCLKDPIPEILPEVVEEKTEEANDDDLLPPELRALMAKNSKDVRFVLIFE